MEAPTTSSEQTTVLITGGNKGLGLEAARRLGDLGWTISSAHVTKAEAGRPPMS